MTADDLPAAFATVPPAWRAVLPGWTDERIAEVVGRVKAVSGDRPIGPPDPFRALRFVDPGGIKVVLIGQDPYPRPGHADGLAFSAGHGKPASLRRVFQVLAQDRPGWQPPQQWKLDGWARQGVLLLNPALSIEIGQIGSHLDCGWQSLTSEIVQALCRLEVPPVFLIWGSKARAFVEAACGPRAVDLRMLATRHPSNDFERRFMADGSHFSATADLIDWWDLR
jgi:uracil-DNA glycosylase